MMAALVHPDVFVCCSCYFLPLALCSCLNIKAGVKYETVWVLYTLFCQTCLTGSLYPYPILEHKEQITNILLNTCYNTDFHKIKGHST